MSERLLRNYWIGSTFHIVFVCLDTNHVYASISSFLTTCYSPNTYILVEVSLHHCLTLTLALTPTLNTLTDL